MRRLGSFLALMMLASASSAPGYYHFIHYSSRLGPYTPVYEKFDLNALPNKTVYFYISEDHPSLAASDSYEALIAQIRQGLAAWNSVPTSDLRVVYGGVANLGSLQTQTPAGEIVFAELAPGILGLGGPSIRQPQAGGFVPILRSQVMLPRDLSNPNRTSASESFFTSMVHEIGHALGLQHSLTGSVMTVEVTRSTTRSRPLAADDMAGLGVLYPVAGYAGTVGTITGRVTNPSGRGLPLVSVVAVNPSGAVISALTAPDGTYRIEGLPPGSYITYAHGLPPATQSGMGPADIVLPTDASGASFDAAGAVETQFYGGGRDPSAAFPVVVNAGLSSDGVDFRLAERGALPIYNVTTYSFPGNGAPAVLPAFLNIAQNTGTVIATGPGLAANLRSTSVGILGGGLQVRSGPVPYGPDPRYAQIDLDFNPFTGTGQRHLVFSVNGDVYVRPGGVTLAAKPAPLVRQVQAESDAGGGVVLAISGDNLGSDSRVFVDGYPVSVRSFDDVTGRLRVAPPPGVGGRPAVITICNPDGQSSVFVQSANPATYTYPPADTPSITLNPASGPPGRDVEVEIQGTNTNFVDGQTAVGFGNPDVVARRVWVVSPTRLLVVVSISPRATAASSTASIASGLQLVTVGSGFRVDPAAPGSSSTAPALSFQGLVNRATSQPRVAPGSLATLNGVNLSRTTASASSLPLPTNLGGTTVTINDSAAPLESVSPTQINLQLPFNLSPGPAILRVNNGVETSQPMVVQIDSVAPGLFQVLSSAGTILDANTPARLGDTLVLLATGLGAVTPPATAGAAAPLVNTSSVVRVSVGGTELVPSFAGLAPGTAGVYQVNVPLPLFLPAAASTQIFLTVDGQTSNVLTIALR